MLHGENIIFEINNCVKISKKPIKRKRPLNTSKVYRIVINVYICPFDSHMCAIVNL